MPDDSTKKPQRPSPSEWVLVALFGVIVALILLSVFFRYVVNHSLVWSDEVVRYLFVWFTLLGAVLVLRDRRHIRVEYFVELLPRPIRRIVEAAMFVVVTLFQIFLIVAGFGWVAATAGTSTPALGLPLNWIFYASIPITAVLGLFYCVGRLRRGQFAELDVGTETAGAGKEATP